MRLKNILIVVKDIEKSKHFYQNLFGLQVIRDFGENVMLSEGLVLQEQKCWEELTGMGTVVGNASELFFEETDFDSFISKMEQCEMKVETVGTVRTNSWGKRAILVKDPDGHLIEVAEV